MTFWNYKGELETRNMADYGPIVASRNGYTMRKQTFSNGKPQAWFIFNARGYSAGSPSWFHGCHGCYAWKQFLDLAKGIVA